MTHMDEEMNESALSLKSEFTQHTEQSSQKKESPSQKELYKTSVNNGKLKLKKNCFIVYGLNRRMVGIIVGLMGFNLAAFFFLLIAICFARLIG